MTDEEYSALANQTRTIQDLQEHPGWAMLVDYAKHETRGRRHKLLSGFCDTHEDYLKTSGYLSGIDWVLLGVVEELQTKLDGESARRRERATGS